MRRSAPRLPAARHFCLTWGLADQHGGMTSAMLRRSRSFCELGGASVDVLTLDDRPDYPEHEAALRRTGGFVDGMRLRNLWDDLRERQLHPRDGEAELERPELLVPHDDDEVTAHGGVVLSRVRRDAGGRVRAADRFRRDGSLLATERAGTGRRIVLFAPDGTPVRSWRTSRALHRWWFDRLTAGKPSFLLVDSKTAARSVADYRRPHVTTVHIVHASHRIAGRPKTLRASRESVLRRAGDFDVIVVLTERQRIDLTEDLAAVDVSARIGVVPNGVELPASFSAPRNPAHGVMVASLHTRKRLDHAVSAIALARAGGADVEAEIFGEGPCEQSLRAQITELGAGDSIHLRGHRPDARESFRTAGFSLLTSTSEGLPLVLAESMAAGCLPIAYDIRYGPADMIRDGVDGFVVRAGDADAVARRIVELQSMPAAQLDQMRRRARQRASEFSDTAVTARWSRELRATSDAKLIRAAADQPLPVRMRRRAGILRRRLRWMLGR